MGKWHHVVNHQVQIIKENESQKWVKEARFRNYYFSAFVCVQVPYWYNAWLKVRRKVALFYGLILWSLSAASAILNGVELDAYDQVRSRLCRNLTINLSTIYECLLLRWLHWTVPFAASALPLLLLWMLLMLFMLVFTQLQSYQLYQLSSWQLFYWSNQVKLDQFYP